MSVSLFSFWGFLIYLGLSFWCCTSTWLQLSRTSSYLLSWLKMPSHCRSSCVNVPLLANIAFWQNPLCFAEKSLYRGHL